MYPIFEQLRVGGDRNFGYLLGDRDARQAVLIDPSYAPEALVERAQAQKLKITHIINTHGHHDHTNGNEDAVRLSGAQVAAHPASPVVPDLPLADGSTLQVGGLTLVFYHTPGHCEDHLVVYEKTCELLITGDLLFVGKVSGTASDDDAATEWDSLQRLLTLLPSGTAIWPGHDYGARPASTLALERKSNPFLLCGDVAAFQRLKNEWPQYKAAHGLR